MGRKMLEEGMHYLGITAGVLFDRGMSLEDLFPEALEEEELVGADIIESPEPIPHLGFLQCMLGRDYDVDRSEIPDFMGLGAEDYDEYCERISAHDSSDPLSLEEIEEHNFLFGNSAASRARLVNTPELSKSEKVALCQIEETLLLGHGIKTGSIIYQSRGKNYILRKKESNGISHKMLVIPGAGLHCQAHSAISRSNGKVTSAFYMLELPN